jgi:hypothetical protein
VCHVLVARLHEVCIIMVCVQPKAALPWARCAARCSITCTRGMLALDGELVPLLHALSAHTPVASACGGGYRGALLVRPCEVVYKAGGAAGFMRLVYGKI